MSSRVIAIVILIATVSFITVMASVQFFIRDPLPIIGANQMLHLRTRAVEPPVAVQIAVDGGFRVELQFQHPGHDDPPQFALRPVDSAPIPMSTESDGATHYTARGQLTRPGRWDLDIDTPGGQETLEFVVRE